MISKYDKVYMEMAIKWSSLSSAVRKKVGCLVVKDRMIISDGYNGTVAGSDNSCEYIDYIRKKHPYLDGVEADSEGYIFNKGRKVAKTLTKYGKYEQCRINGKKYRVHRLIMETFVENPDKDFYKQVNHKNKNGLDNRLINLEWCSNRYNSIHRDSSKYKSSKYPGVSWSEDRGKWVASVLLNGKQIKKRFNNEKSARDFYNSFVDERDFEGISYIDIKTKWQVLHAEANALTKLAGSTQSGRGSTLYVTYSPCRECSKLIYQTGVKRVVYLEEYRDTSGIDFLKELGVEVEKIEL